MKKKIIFLLVMGSYSIGLVAQKDYTMQEAVLGLGQSLKVESLEGLKFFDNNSYQRIITVDKEKYIVNYSLKNDGKTDTLLSLSQFNRYFATQNDSVKSFPSLYWRSSKEFLFSHKNKYYKGLLDNVNRSIVFVPTYNLPQDAENITQDNYRNIIVYTLKNNLYCIDKSGITHQITNDAAPHIVNGQSVHRNEFGITGGIFIAPNARFVAYYKMDESMVADYPIVEWGQVPATTRNIKYPMAGDTSHQVSLWIYDLVTKTNTKVSVQNQPEDYLTNITWQPSSEYIYITHLDRAQQNAALRKYRATDGQFVMNLINESHSKYVEPQHPLYFLPNGKEFIYWSQKDGHMHLYKYDTDGRLIKQLTKGAFVVNEIIGIAPKEKNIYITANASDPREQHIYAVHYDKGIMQQVSVTPGMNSGTVSEDGSFIINELRNERNPRTINVINTKDKKTKALLQAKNTLDGYNNAIVRSITLKADDGSPLYGKLMLPYNFDSTKQYPVIVYLYNGPHVQLINRSFPESGNLWYDLMTQKGFIVFSMDGRGSSNRGAAFEQAVHRQLGTVEMQDQLQGVDYLKSLPFVNPDRMGVYGWSFGGFMTTSLMTRHPGVFKVGVAGGPVIDWSMYEIMYTERYMGTPQNNKEGYEQSELTSKAKNLQGKLLMIHGADDDVVVWQHSIKFIKACVDAGKQVDYFVYPGHPHNVRGKDRVHLMQKITDYFVQNL